MGGGWRIVMAVLLGCWLWLTTPAIAGAADLAQTPLTITALQARIDQPVRRDGKLTIDLRDVVLDLRAENGEFGDRFYRLLQTTLQRGDTVFNLDLSHAVVKGEFDLQRLSLREPLYGDAFFSLLSDREQSQLKRDRLSSLCVGDDFTFLEVDVAAPNALKAALGDRKPRQILHLAAQAGVRYSLQNPAAYT